MDEMQSLSIAKVSTSFVSTVIPEPTPAPLLAAALSALSSSKGGQNSNENSGGSWSSFIGIVTAICGNILISFALNVQRYAHVRIDREWERERVRFYLKRGPPRHSSAYGAATAASEEDDGEQLIYPIFPQSTLNPENPEWPRGARLECHRIGLTENLADGEHSGNLDPQCSLQQSFLSDRTVRPAGSESSDGDRMNYLRSPYWWCGIVLMTLGEAGNFLAYGFAPASIVSPLGVVALISNCVIAPFMLKEKFRTRDFWGVMIAISGAVVVVLSAKTSEVKIGPDDIWDMISRWEFELYLGITATLIVVLMAISGKYGSRVILIDLGLVGLFGGYTVLSTKGVASLLSFTLWHVITFPITYLLVAVLTTSALMQIRYLNCALQRFDSTQVIPIQFVMFTLCVIVGSAVLYRDFESTTASRAAKFVGGCIMTFLGVYLITSGRVRADDGSSDVYDEEAIGLLTDERCPNGADLAPVDQNRRTDIHGHTSVTERAVAHSTPYSLSHRSVESNEDALRTPKGVLSPSGSFRADSLSARSLSISSQDLTLSSPSHPQSLIVNPWAESSEPLIEGPDSESAANRVDPTSQQVSGVQPVPSLLLRFPQAPGESPSPCDTTPAKIHPSPSKVDIPGSGTRQSVSAPTPQSSARNSLSLRLKPAPLLPPLSSGLSAVVVDSIRRVKHDDRRRKRSIHNCGEFQRDGYGGSREAECEADVQPNSHGTGISTPSSAPKNTNNSSRSLPVDDNPSGGASASNNHTSKSDGSKRMSWNGWLSETFRGPKKKETKEAPPRSPRNHSNSPYEDSDQ